MKDIINKQGVVLNHQPDGSVVMNDGLHLKPTDRKDGDGFTRKQNDRVIVAYNFDTRVADVTHKGRILWGRVYLFIGFIVVVIISLLLAM